MTQEKKPPPSTRQRKSHRKSRLGCTNCKLRSIKCDESKPSCKRCLNSNFTCSYSSSSSSSSSGPLQLELALTGAFKLDFVVPVPASLPAPPPRIRIPVAGPSPSGFYEMQPFDFAVLSRFRTRTVNTVGSRTTRHLYREAAYTLSTNSSPFLLHVFLALTLLHDMCLASSSAEQQQRFPPAHRAALAFHWYHATALFHQKLAAGPRALSGSDRDALWTSAALLGAATAAWVGALEPESAWPLREPGVMDLDWLKMSDGKKAVWEIVDPSRTESIYHPLLEALKGPGLSIPDGSAPIPPFILPPAFYALCNIMPESCSSPETNPYHVAVSIIAQLIPLSLNDDTVLHFLAFISQMDPSFRRLLEAKDPRAMLLLAWWYGKVCIRGSWWLQRRAVVEGQAICIFLERECGSDEDMMSLVEYPKRMFELVRDGMPGERKGLVGHEVSERPVDVI